MNGNLRDLAIYVKNKFDYPITAVEVGVEHGFNASEMLNRMNIKTLYLVDPYTAYIDCLTNGVIQEALDESYQKMLFSIRYFLDKTVVVKKTSIEASKDFEDNFFDFVYIDASHDYEPVKADINAWWPKVKIGGIIGGHDYKWSPHVERAVREFTEQYNLEFMEFLADERQTEWGIIK
jgi:predicted O-methyltransferase YrrM